MLFQNIKDKLDLHEQTVTATSTVCAPLCFCNAKVIITFLFSVPLYQTPLYIALYQSFDIRYK